MISTPVMNALVNTTSEGGQAEQKLKRENTVKITIE